MINIGIKNKKDAQEVVNNFGKYARWDTDEECYISIPNDPNLNLEGITHITYNSETKNFSETAIGENWSDQGEEIRSKEYVQKFLYENRTRAKGEREI